MDWVRNNKFLAGLIAFMVIGVGGLGFFLYTTEANYDKVSQEYNSQVTELKRLQAYDPYPDDANLKRFAEQKAHFAEAVTTLQSDLAALSTAPEKALSPTEFQNRLRVVAQEVTGSATQAGVALPTDFYLGFESYRETLPDAAATPLLTAQLSEIDQIVRILIGRKVDKITSIKRAPLPGESGAGLVGAPTPTPVPGEKPKGGAELVTRYPIQIAFSAAPNAFRETLAQIASAPRLFVIRALRVKNQVDKGPVRGQDAAVPGGTAKAGAPAAAPGAGEQPLPEKGPPPLRYVVGQEKLDVDLHVELTRVLPVVAAK